MLSARQSDGTAVVQEASRVQVVQGGDTLAAHIDRQSSTSECGEKMIIIDCAD